LFFLLPSFFWYIAFFLPLLLSLALLRDDRAALYDTLALRHTAAQPDLDPAIAQRWRLVDEDLEELALVARLLSDALDDELES